MKKTILALSVALALTGIGLKPASTYAMALYHAPNYYEEYIVQHESSGRSWAVNSIGCIGLMQACPGTKLSNACPNWTWDINCQLRFFNGYMSGRYGTWYVAYVFHVHNSWW